MSNEQLIFFIKYLLILGLVLILLFLIVKLLKKSPFIAKQDERLRVICFLKIDQRHSAYLLKVLGENILFITSPTGVTTLKINENPTTPILRERK